MSSNRTGTQQRDSDLGEKINLIATLINREYVTIARFLRYEPTLFLAATALACSIILIDGLGIGLILVLLDGIQTAPGQRASAFAQMPLFGELIAAFSTMSGGARLQIVAVLLAGLAIVRGAVTYARTMMQRVLETRIDARLRNLVFGRVMLGAIGDVESQAASWHYNLLTSFPGQASAAAARVVSIIASLFSIAVVICYVLLVSWQLTALALVLLGVAMIATQRLVMPRMRNAGEALNRQLIDFSNYSFDSVFGLSVIRAFAREKARIDQFSTLLARQIRLTLRAQHWTSVAEPLYTASIMIAIAALMFAVGYIIQNDTSRIPILISFILILSRLSHPVLSLNEGVNYIALQSNAVNVLGDFLDRPQGRTVTEGARQCPPLKARLELRDVSFRYSDERPPVLDAVSLSIAKGSFVALVGGSGGGKTTIVRLMARLIDPSAGGVFADGVDLREYTTASWRAGIGVIPQDIYLFNDTIAANLRLAKPEATDAELVAAAKAAHAHDFIMAQPKGYATLVGDRGSAFSGGQQQRLAIARALIADPAVIIMDEATSNLDTESEREIKKVIAELRGRRTIVVVAHRLSTIEGADEILVIEGGKLVERGSHATLRAAAGVYAKLVGHDAVA